MVDAKNRIVTLTTDFGYQDPYVGTMKGVMLAICAYLNIVDLTHAVTPFSVLEAGFVLQGAHSYFPRGTLHVAVVDPGVGGVRRIIYLEKNGQRFLAPDNGLLTRFFDGASTILSVEESEFLPDRSSRTFHGRDIFAPLAARLCAGLDPGEVGPAVVGKPTQTYEETERGKPLALINSFGLLEIALRERNAAKHFGAGTGDEVIAVALKS